MWFRTGKKHWISTTLASGTLFLVLLAFSATACSDPGIVYRAPDPAAGGQGTASGVERMEAGDVLCGESPSGPAFAALPLRLSAGAPVSVFDLCRLVCRKPELREWTGGAVCSAVGTRLQVHPA